MAYDPKLAMGLRGSAPATAPVQNMSGQDLVKLIRSGQQYTTPLKK